MYIRVIYANTFVSIQSATCVYISALVPTDLLLSKCDVDFSSESLYLMTWHDLNKIFNQTSTCKIKY